MSSSNSSKPNKKQIHFSKSGRYFFDCKTLIEQETVLSKLNHAFSLGCTDKEACIYAGISLSSLYRYEGQHRSFREQKQVLKAKPVLLARATVVQILSEKNENNFPTDRALRTAWKYLEKKLPQEFGYPSVINRYEEHVSSHYELSNERKRQISSALDSWERKVRVIAEAN